jgi:hypothetical protein
MVKLSAFDDKELNAWMWARLHEPPSINLA